MKRAGWITVFLVVVIVGCAAPQAQDSPELAALGDEWGKRFNAGDIDGVVALYAEDARLLPPNGEMLVGHDAIRTDFEGLAAAGLTGTLETIDAMVAGDMGHRVGTYTLNAPDGAVADRGKYIETWRRIDGEWKMTNDIYNSDLAAGPSGTLMIAAHEVGDPAVWLAAWQENSARRQEFSAHGVASTRVFQHPENQSMTGLLLDVVDMEAFHAFLESEEGAAAAKADTVDLGATIVLHEVD